MEMRELREYQKKDLEFHLSKDRTCNYSEAGTGKSPTFATYIYYRFLIDGTKSVLICPGGIMKKNQEDVCDWSGWSEDEVVIVKGDKTKREAAYKKDEVKCFIISADTFGKEWEILLENQPKINCCVIDEVHLLYSGHTSKRTQALYAASRKIKYFMFCTGTPLNGKFSSVYPTIAIIEPRFYMNYQNFLNYHGVYDKFGRVVGWGRADKLRNIIDRISVRHTFKECYPNSKGYIMFYEKADMDEALKENYAQIEEEALLELEDSNLDCNNPCVKAMRCRQLLSCPESLNLAVKPKINGKDELLRVHLETAKEENARLLIFSVFVQEQYRIKRLCEEIGLSVGLINGSVSNTKRGEIDVAFRNHDLDVVVASPQTASIGFNFGFAKEVIFVSMDYQDSSFEQGIQRLDRGQREGAIPVYVIGYGSRVERRIMEIVKRKMKEKHEIFGLN